MRFKELRPSIFKGDLDSNNAESQVREMETMFEVMKCAEGDKVLLRSFMLRNRVKGTTSKDSTMRQGLP